MRGRGRGTEPRGRKPTGSKSNTLLMAMRRHLETTDFSGYTRVLARRRSVIPLQLVKKMGESKSDTTGGRGNGRRLRKATLTCMRCRLSMLDWPYCGMTGEPHRMEEVAPICG